MTESKTTRNVPLFPLSTVLFPQGILPLRIFEPRYLTMVGECMRNGSEFGVVLLAEGKEAGSPTRFHQIGTLARIEDFDQLEDGNLGITCRGGQRFSVVEHSLQDDKLICAEITVLDESDKDDISLPTDYSSMREFVRDLTKRDELKEWTRSINPEWDNADWLSCRLSELLPLTMESRQALLEMALTDRLTQLSSVMRENRLI